MTKKIVLILFAVFFIAFFLAACHPHHWHRGCENIGFFGPDHARPMISEPVTAQNVSEYGIR